MMKRIRAAAATCTWMAALVFVACAAAPSSHGDAIDPARAARGRQVRTVLLDALENAYTHGGTWPERLDAGAGLTYTRPQLPTDGPLVRAAPAATVVLHESFEAYPDGVWVGYADGHLEFAPTRDALHECVDQITVLRESHAPPVAATQPAAPTSAGGDARLKLVGPDGKPVAGALVGVFVSMGNDTPDAPAVRFALRDDEGHALVSDEAGSVVLPAAKAFAAKFHDQPTVPLYILHKGRGLIAQPDVARADFAPGAPVREIRLDPACRVTGRLTCLGLPDAHVMTYTSADVTRIGRRTYYTIDGFNKGTGGFELLLAPGDHELEFSGTGTDRDVSYLRIPPGRRELTLHIDLPASRTMQLVGKPAPELRSIKGWKNTPGGNPLTLEGLRGKAVLLDFWGHWCGPCVHEMPALMKLYDEYRAEGLEIIAVHDDSVPSIDEMDRRLERVRRELWAGRDLPFPVALDGGGPTRIVYSTRTERGATTALYGIDGFPTTLLIDRNGTLVGEVDVDGEKGREQILKCLRDRAAPPAK